MRSNSVEKQGHGPGDAAILSPDELARMQVLNEARAHPFNDLVGKPAGNFTVTTIGGKPLQLRELKGHPVIISFLRLQACLPCIHEIKILQRIRSKCRNSGLVSIVLLQTTPGFESPREELRRFFKSVLSRTAFATAEISAAYGNNRLVPYSVYVNRKGVIVQQSGFETLESMDQSLRRLLVSK